MSDEIANNTLLLQHIVNLLTNEPDTTNETITNARAAAGGGSVNYKRWGRTECQENATLVYAGILLLCSYWSQIETLCETKSSLSFFPLIKRDDSFYAQSFSVRCASLIHAGIVMPLSVS